MHCVFGWSGVPTRPGRSARVTWGVYDGVHLGHQAVIDELSAWAHRDGAESVVLTFDPHPQAFLRGDTIPLILPPEERARQIARRGVDWVVVAPFDAAMAGLSAEAFVDEILLGRLAAGGILMGYDSAFGRGREGTIEMLRVIASARDVAVRAAAPRLLEGRPVKSSQLRRAIAEGDLAAARAMMGRPATLVGRVARGDGRGRSLGFPTANLDCRALVLPPAGVYAIRGWVRGPGIGIEEHGDGPLPGAMYIGRLPTFGGADLPRVEAHLFDFPAGRNLYGMTMSVELVDRLREDRRFADAESLRAQIAADCRKAREVLQPADGRPMSCGCSPWDAGVE